MIPAGYSVDAISGTVIGRRGKPIRKKCRGGYIQIDCHGRHMGMAHRVMWESVHGPIPAGMQINHINGIKGDNRIANLELVTPSENALHAYRIGLASASGDRNGRAKLSWTEVQEIRSATGVSRRHLASLYGVSPKTISEIQLGRRWRKQA
jgi:hypothetical protein